MEPEIDLSIVIPAFNEAEIVTATVGHVVEGLRERGASFEVIVVENGSTDDTAAITRRLTEELAELRTDSLTRPDYGAALRHGLLGARGSTVVNFDMDFYDLGFLEVALDRLASTDSPAIVVGSKRAPGAADSRPLVRRLVTRAFVLLLRFGFRLGVSDTHGMKAMRREPVTPIARSCRFGTDLFDTELILRAERAGLLTAEIPVNVREMRPARTSIFRRAPRALVGLVRLRVALWRERP